MYVRAPNSAKNQVKIPENYGGSAFGSSGYYNDMPPPVRQTPPRVDVPLQRSDIPPEPMRDPSVSDTQVHEPYIPPSNALVPQATETYQKTEDKHTGSIFSSLIPSSKFMSSHFPFGHGIGGEELLILGMMLLVYLSGSECGETDHEFILLLGLLLFAG